MGLLIGDNFNYQANKPNFERDSFATLAAMKAYPETSIDDGHISYCAETDKHYKFLSSNTVDDTTGKWREFETGAGIPEGGTTGQVLTKTEEGTAWQDPQATFPEGGTTGQVLKKTADGVEWGDDEKGFELPSGGSVGQVLKKTASGTEWANDNDTTYQKATQQADGLMSKEDKTKLDNITTAYASIMTQAEYDELNPKEEDRIYYIKG